MEPENKIPFNNSSAYKLGAVTYEVTAHFCSDGDLKNKIFLLLKEKLSKT